MKTRDNSSVEHFFISDDIEAQLRTHKVFNERLAGVCEKKNHFPKYFLSPYHNKKHFSGLLFFSLPRHSTRRDSIGRQHIARATNTFANGQHKALRYLEEWPADDAFYWLWNFNYFPPNKFVHVSAIYFSQPGLNCIARSNPWANDVTWDDVGLQRVSFLSEADHWLCVNISRSRAADSSGVATFGRDRPQSKIMKRVSRDCRACDNANLLILYCFSGNL